MMISHFEPKPCACGRDGCMVVRRETMKNWQFRKTRFASRSCARWHRNMTDPAMFEARRKGATSQSRARGYGLEGDEFGALVTPVAWLNQPPVRVRLALQAEGRC